MKVDGSDFSAYSDTFFIKDYLEIEYEQVCAGLGDKIMRIQIVYSKGLTIKDIKLEKQK